MTFCFGELQTTTINLHLLLVSWRKQQPPSMSEQDKQCTINSGFRSAHFVTDAPADCKILVDSHLSSNSRRIGDGIILKQMTVEVLKTVAHVLAQSVALDYHGK